MFDRTFIIILVLFVAVGIFAYDRYISEKGEISPVAQIIDFANSMRIEDWRTTTITKTRRSFQLDAESNLSRLKEKHLAIKEQRLQLIANRNEILNILIGMIDEIEVEAKEYARIIQKDQDEFLARFPRIQDLGVQLMRNRQQPDPAIREQTYQKIRSALLDLLEELYDHPEGEDYILNDMFEKIDGILSEDIGIILEEDYARAYQCQDSEQCLNRQIHLIEKNIRMTMDESLAQPNDSLTELMQLLREIRKRYQTILMDYENSEKSFQIISQKVQSRFKELVEQLVLVTENDLRDLMRLYEELGEEHKIFLEQLDYNLSDLKQSSIENKDRINAILLSLTMDSGLAFERLINASAYFEMQLENLLEQAQQNEANIHQTVNDHLIENEIFLEETANLVGVNMKRLLEDEAYREEQFVNYVANRLHKDQESESGVGINNDTLVEEDLGLPQDLSDAEDLRKKNQEVERQLQKMRQKARDQRL